MNSFKKVTIVRLLSVPSRIGVFFALFGSFPGTASAADYLCNKDGVTYWIKIEYENADQVLPCSVFRWIVPQERELLWRATKDPGFCEAKADEIRQKLVTYGWLCQDISTSTGNPSTNRSQSNEPVM